MLWKCVFWLLMEHWMLARFWQGMLSSFEWFSRKAVNCNSVDVTAVWAHTGIKTWKNYICLCRLTWRLTCSSARRMSMKVLLTFKIVFHDVIVQYLKGVCFWMLLFSSSITMKLSWMHLFLFSSCFVFCLVLIMHPEYKLETRRVD